MRLPNLLASKKGRLAAFFFLYMTEGIPLGFTATAVATRMRRQGLEHGDPGARQQVVDLYAFLSRRRNARAIRAEYIGAALAAYRDAARR